MAKVETDKMASVRSTLSDKSDKQVLVLALARWGMCMSGSGMGEDFGEFMVVVGERLGGKL